MRTPRTSQRGIALIVVMLLTVAVTALVAGAIYLSGTSKSISSGQEREEEMRNAADAGIELGRSALNGGSVTLDTIYHALSTNQAVYDANGVQIPNVTRSIYYGPTGSTTGQYGIFASIVSVITDPSGAVVVRRGEMAQESFAKFAYYTDNEGVGICFGSGDNIWGPVHTNTGLCIYSSGARFHSTLEVAGTITGKQYGVYDQGYTENSPVVPMPTVAQLANLNSYATAGGMSYTAPTGGTSWLPRMRIEFVSIDLDGDGRVTGPDEGFYRVYVDTGAVNTDYLNASRINNANTSQNCGHFHGNGKVFFTAWQHKNMAINSAPNNTWPHVGTAPPSTNAANESLTSTATGALRCWLGGDEHLFLTAAPGGQIPRNTFVPADFAGRWLQYTATPNAAVIAGLANPASNTVDTSLVNRTLLAQYLWPLSRTYNPNSKGVIYVVGDVALSGVLNGRLTLASSSNIVIDDDLRYAIAPGAAPCAASNILGLLAPDTISLADNTINSPWDYTSGAALSPSSTARSYDETDDETVYGVILTLKSFYNQNHSTGGTNQQPCQTTAWGRGCINLTGGIIQQVRGAMGTTGGTGHLKRYSYDVCAFQTPPPYFPTTGRYLRNRYYEIDPVGFNVGSFYASLKP